MCEKTKNALSHRLLLESAVRQLLICCCWLLFLYEKRNWVFFPHYILPHDCTLLFSFTLFLYFSPLGSWMCLKSGFRMVCFWVGESLGVECRLALDSCTLTFTVMEELELIWSDAPYLQDSDRWWTSEEQFWVINVWRTLPDVQYLKDFVFDGQRLKESAFSQTSEAQFVMLNILRDIVGRPTSGGRFWEVQQVQQMFSGHHLNCQHT